MDVELEKRFVSLEVKVDSLSTQLSSLRRVILRILTSAAIAGLGGTAIATAAGCSPAMLAAATPAISDLSRPVSPVTASATAEAPPAPSRQDLLDTLATQSLMTCREDLAVARQALTQCEVRLGTCMARSSATYGQNSEGGGWLR